MNANQKRMAIFLLPLVIFLLLIAMFFFRLGRPTDVVVTTSINKPLPEFSLPLLSDTTRIMTNADLPTTPFLLNVWGSWCPTCFVEHPFLMQLSQQGVPMIGINYKDELSDALAYLSKHQDPFMYSLQDKQGSYAIDLGLTGAPETFVVDAKGVVYQHILGEINQENWTQTIKPCLDILAQTVSAEQKLQVCQ